MIHFSVDAYDVIVKDAIQSFPDECCGFLFGAEDAQGNRAVVDALVVNNAKEGDKRKRFEISPRDYLQAEQYAEEQELQLLGVYHSHPDHPAIPSEHDRVAAQPYFSYLIVSVHDKHPDHTRSWVLNESLQFEEEKIFQHTSQPVKQQ